MPEEPSDNDIFEHGKSWEEADILERAADSHLGDPVRRGALNMPPFKHNVSAGWPVNPGYEVKARRLSSPVRTDQTKKISLFQGKGDFVDGNKTAELYGGVLELENAHADTAEVGTS